MNTALKNVLTLLIPLSMWMMVVAQPTVRFIFQQGRFGPRDTLATTLLLQILLTAVFCWGFQQVLARAYYARQDTISPAVIGTAATVISIPIYIMLANSFGAPGVAAASVGSIFIYTGVLTWWWKRKNGGETFSGLASGALKVLAVSAAASAPAYAMSGLRVFDPAASPYLAALCSIALGGACFTLVFALLSARFVPDLVRPFLEKAGPLGRMLVGPGPASQGPRDPE